MKINKLLMIAGAMFGTVLVLFYVAVYTTPGSKFIAGKILSGYVGKGNMGYQSLSGNLGHGMVFHNLEIKDIEGFPEGTTLRIQKIFFNATALSLNGLDVEAENLRLKLPDSDPIIVSGTLKEGELDINIYSKGFTVNEVLTYLPDLKRLVPVKGDVNDIDLFVTGSYRKPIVKGSFVIERFVYKGFLLTGAFLNADVQLKGKKNNVQLHGNVVLEKGELQTKRTLVKLGKSDLKFSGPWNQPYINLKGNAKVEKTRINIVLKGTPEKPELALSSEPSYPRERLMVMLATGKSWQSVEDSVNEGLNSAALTKDFIDYFFFAGKSNQFAKQFGISDFSVTLDQNQKGIAAKKELSENIEVGYGVEQTKTNGQVTDVSQKLGGEYRVNDQISVGVEREMKKKQSSDAFEEQINENNDKVLLKYKKSF